MQPEGFAKASALKAADLSILDKPSPWCLAPARAFHEEMR